MKPQLDFQSMLNLLRAGNRAMYDKLLMDGIEARFRGMRPHDDAENYCPRAARAALATWKQTQEDRHGY